MTKVPKKVIYLSVIILTVLIGLSSFIVVGYLQLLQDKISFTNTVTTKFPKDVAKINETLWDNAYIMLLNSYSSSESFAKELKSEFIQRVDATYKGDHVQKNKDLLLINEPIGSGIKTSLGETLTNKYFLGIKNDNNDPYAMTTKNILTDYSFNCSPTGSFRTLSEEIEKHFNKYLARECLDSIVERRMSDYKFWIYLPIPKTEPFYDDLKNLNRMDLGELKKIFLKHDGNVDMFKYIEFITTVYVLEDVDLSGKQYIENGIKNTDTNAIIINSGFNLFDVKSSNPEFLSQVSLLQKEKVELYNKLELSTERYLKDNNTKTGIIIIEFMCLLLSFLSLVKINNNFVER